MYQFMLICLLPACLSAMEQPSKYSEKKNKTFTQEMHCEGQEADAQHTSKSRIGARIGTGVALGALEAFIIPIFGPQWGFLNGAVFSSYAFSQLSRCICHHDGYFHASHIISSWLMSQFPGLIKLHNDRVVSKLANSNVLRSYSEEDVNKLRSMCPDEKTRKLIDFWAFLAPTCSLAGTIPSMQYFLEKYCFPESVSSQQ